MPVVLTPELINTWIMEPKACRELLKKIPPQLLDMAEDNQRHFGNAPHRSLSSHRHFF